MFRLMFHTTIGVLCCLAVQTHAKKFSATAISFNQPIIIDGTLTDWDLSNTKGFSAVEMNANVSHIEEGSLQNNEDYAGTFYFGYDHESLYVAAVIADNQVVAPHKQGDIWLDDLVELLFEIPGQKRAQVLHIGISASAEVHIFSPLTLVINDLRKKVTAKNQMTRQGYVLEIKIARELLGLAKKLPQFTRFNIAGRDVDTSETPSLHMTWSGVRHHTFASMGLLVFIEVPPEQVATEKPSCSHHNKAIVIRRPIGTHHSQLVAENTNIQLRMVNFQSSLNNWQMFWETFDREQIVKDLDQARFVGANSIRIFIFYDSFGGAKIIPEKLEQLRFVIDTASQKGLLSVVTFFPFKKEFRPERWGEMESHVRNIVKSFQNHPGIAMWDLMNEPDHAWGLKPEFATVDDVYAWAIHMIQVAKAADPSHLITLGLAGHFMQENILADKKKLIPEVDVLSVHGYFDHQKIPRLLATARKLFQGPIILQEVGVSSMYYTDDEAYDFYKQYCQWVEQFKFQGLGAWELFDHPLGSLKFTDNPYLERDENSFGLLTTRGELKKQALAFCQCLNVPQFVIQTSK